MPGADTHTPTYMTEGAETAAPAGAVAAASHDAGSARVRERLLARARRNLELLRPELLAGGGEPRLTLVVLTLDRPRIWPLLLGSIRDHVRVPIKLLIVDDGSQPAARAELQRLCDELNAAAAAGAAGGLRGLDLVWLDRALYCPAARRFAAARVTTDYLMFLDDDAEIFPGTLEHLVQALDADPAVLAAGAHVVLPDATTQICGGEYWEEADGVLHFEPLGMGLDFEDPALGPSRSCQWLAGAAMAVRRSALVEEPLDLGMVMYYEDNEWYYRLASRQPPPVFRRSVEALVLHYQELKGPRAESREEVLRSLPYLQSIAHFYRVHERILEGVFVFAPRLVVAGGRRDTVAARLLLELLAARGSDWLAREWLEGGLAPLFGGGIRDEARAAAASQAAAQAAVAAAAAESAESALAETRAALDARAGELAAAHAALAARTDELATVGQRLATVERESAAALAESARQLAIIHRSRLWRLADAYWRLRRGVARVAGRDAGRPPQT